MQHNTPIVMVRTHEDFNAHLHIAAFQKGCVMLELKELPYGREGSLSLTQTKYVKNPDVSSALERESLMDAL